MYATVNPFLWHKLCLNEELVIELVIVLIELVIELVIEK